MLFVTTSGSGLQCTAYICYMENIPCSASLISSPTDVSSSGEQLPDLRFSMSHTAGLHVHPSMGGGSPRLGAVP